MSRARTRARSSRPLGGDQPGVAGPADERTPGSTPAAGPAVAMSSRGVSLLPIVRAVYQPRELGRRIPAREVRSPERSGDPPHFRSGAQPQGLRHGLRSARRAPERSPTLCAMAAETISFARGAPSLDIVDVEGLKAAAARAFDSDPGGVT